jgi:hypothetical protein
MHICIIGIAGVGKAHALAAAKFLDGQKSGTGIITLVDYQDKLNNNLGPLQEVWTNSWGPISDSYCICDTREDQFITVNRVALENMTDINSIGADLYIISTPNEYHEIYLHSIKSGKILCEKPLVAHNQIPEWGVLDTVHLGIEWLFHPDVEKVRRVKSISFVHGFPPDAAFWDTTHEVFDLGSHVISIYQYLSGIDMVYFKSISRSGRVVTCITDDGTELQFGYKKGVTTDSIIINGDLVLEWIPFESGDLFYKQIEYIMSNKPSLLNTSQIYIGHSTLQHIRKAIV